MKFLTLLPLLAATAIATPVERAAEREFHLKTAGASQPRFNDLFVYAYHTGAGFNDAMLAKEGGPANKFYFNGTEALADLGTAYPWGVIPVDDTNYASWEPVEINAGGGSKGFSISNGNFVWSQKDGFGGWLVCEWFHNGPQLFYLNHYYKPAIPSSCGKVQLKPIYV